MAQILQNALRITYKGTTQYLVSANVHHFNTFYWEDGSYIAVDGGHEYLKRVGSSPVDAEVIDVSLSDNDDYDLIKSWLLWGTHGISGREPLRYVRLMDCSSEHLQAILDFKYPKTKPLNPLYHRVISDILKERNESL